MDVLDIRLVDLSKEIQATKQAAAAANGSGSEDESEDEIDDESEDGNPLRMTASRLACLNAHALASLKQSRPGSRAAPHRGTLDPPDSEDGCRA